MSYQDDVAQYSGYVWIPYVLLLFYLFREHQARKKFPQNLILLLLTLSEALRCVWYFLGGGNSNEVAGRVLNRMAILFQFSAISVLMLMWIRALHISKMADQMNHNTSSTTPNTSSESGSTGREESSLSMRTTALSTRKPARHISRNLQAIERLRQLEYNHMQVLMKVQAERQQQDRIYYVMLANGLVWGFVLLTLLGTSSTWYDINILLIACLCLLEAIVTLVIGVRTSLVLQRELMPIYQQNTLGGAPVRPSGRTPSPTLLPPLRLTDRLDFDTGDTGNGKSGNGNTGTKVVDNYHNSALVGRNGQGLLAPDTNGNDNGVTGKVFDQDTGSWRWYLPYCLPCCWYRHTGLQSDPRTGHERVVQSVHCLCPGAQAAGGCGQELYCLYLLFFSARKAAYGLQLQRDILKNLLLVCTLVFVFFFIRSFVFAYRVLGDAVGSDADDGLSDPQAAGVFYPWLFYQLPSLVPNLVIALGISPPNGVLRKLAMCVSNKKERQKVLGRYGLRPVSLTMNGASRHSQRGRKVSRTASTGSATSNTSNTSNTSVNSNRWSMSFLFAMRGGGTNNNNNNNTNNNTHNNNNNTHNNNNAGRSESSNNNNNNNSNREAPIAEEEERESQSESDQTMPSSPSSAPIPITNNPLHNNNSNSNSNSDYHHFPRHSTSLNTTAVSMNSTSVTASYVATKPIPIPISHLPQPRPSSDPYDIRPSIQSTQSILQPFDGIDQTPQDSHSDMGSSGRASLMSRMSNSVQQLLSSFQSPSPYPSLYDVEGEQPAAVSSSAAEGEGDEEAGSNKEEVSEEEVVQTVAQSHDYAEFIYELSSFSTSHTTTSSAMSAFLSRSA